jgi:hypothetical protein
MIATMQRSGMVAFVGGELDGKLYVWPELPRYYRAPVLRRASDFMRADAAPDTSVEIQTTEYVLTKKEGAFYYIERELMELSKAQGIDPRPPIENLS